MAIGVLYRTIGYEKNAQNGQTTVMPVAILKHLCMPALSVRRRRDNSGKARPMTKKGTGTARYCLHIVGGIRAIMKNIAGSRAASSRFMPLAIFNLWRRKNTLMQREIASAART